ncbi:MAG: hypothetical protein KF681_08720 [Bdellovibrionaceae bacterium]|nr:hypothetical protein [Pseudobdellovibrionaceae bacterium]
MNACSKKPSFSSFAAAMILSSLCFVGESAEAQGFFDIFRPRRSAPRYQPQPSYPPPQPTYAPIAETYGSDNEAARVAAYGTWRLTKLAWTSEDEIGFSQFVTAIGRSGCTTVDTCMRSPANPFRESDPPQNLYKFWSDCADWPYFLRSYYAWKNGLPFVFSSGMVALPLSEEQKRTIQDGTATEQTDVRYSWNGNRPSRRTLLPNMKSGASNFFATHSTIQNAVHTATLRVDPRTNFSDMYTPGVRRGSIRPGTTVYDPSGHVGIVYDVTSDGQVMVFDALIDRKSISPRRPYSIDFYKRSKIEHGGWFQNFRPVVVDNAQYDYRTGSYVNGTARLLTNEEIPEFSTEMFGNTLMNDGKSAYALPGGKVTSSFQEFLRRRMFQGTYKIDVISEFKIRMKAICDDFGSRVSLVQDGTIKGIAAKPHAEVLPNTIYGGSGDWDLYSTPGGDVRRRNSVNLALNYAKELKAQIDRRNPEFSYQGQDLKGDIIKAAGETLKACAITYRNSNGAAVKVNLEELLKRMPLMSFSPYHCVELRWGASSREELASCNDTRDENKMRWYRAQQTLRNQMARDTNIFTGFSLEELERKSANLGPANPENNNLIQRLRNEM